MFKARTQPGVVFEAVLLPHNLAVLSRVETRIAIELYDLARCVRGYGRKYRQDRPDKERQKPD
jgi:hypothetical protein